MTRTMLAKAASLLLLAATLGSAAPPTSLERRDDPHCSIVAGLQVLDSIEAMADVRFYDNSGVWMPEDDPVYSFNGAYFPTRLRTDTGPVGSFGFEGFEQRLWGVNLLTADGSNNGGIMDMEFVYGDSADLPPFKWLDCTVTMPLDDEGWEERQCWFPCAGYTG